MEGDIGKLVATHVPQRTEARQRREILQKTVAYLFLIAGTAVMAIPFFAMVVFSFQEPLEWATTYPKKLVPTWPISFENYIRAHTYQPWHWYYFNSIYIATLTVIGELLSSSLCAYAFARIRFPGREVLFIILLATLMVPIYVTLVPAFFIMKELNWIDTHLPLWVPHWTGGAVSIFLLRQFFLTIPFELEDAAQIDGAGPIQIWWRIMLPLSGPALAVVAIFTFLFSWNDVLRPIVYLNTLEKYTVQIGMAFFKSPNQVDETAMMAIATIAVIPTLTVFMLSQRYFIRGIILSGFKG